MEAIETFEHKGKTIEIHGDVNPESPREWDNLDVMVAFHRRYLLGDKHDYRSENFQGWDELEAQIIKDHDPIAILPLYLYDHSGITIATTPFQCPWDSGQVGFCFVPKAKMLKEWNKKRASKALKAKAFEIIESSVKNYDDFLTGSVFGYIIKDKNGEEVDSCWGFFGLKYAIEEAKNAVVEEKELVTA